MFSPSNFKEAVSGGVQNKSHFEDFSIHIKI